MSGEVRLSDREREALTGVIVNEYRTALPDAPNPAALADALAPAVEAILIARLAAALPAPVGESVPAARLCSQCGELEAAMVKVGTPDGWCTACLDEAAEPTEVPAPGEGDGLEAARDEGIRQAIEWLRADYEYGTGPDWREHGAEWIAQCAAEERREAKP